MMALVIVSGATFAQTGGFNKGSIFGTGSVGFSSEEENGDKTTSFTFRPKVGYFVTSNVAIGLNLGFTSTKRDFGTTDSKSSSFNVGAFGRYYFKPANQFSMFLNLGFDYMGTKNEIGPAETKENGFEIGLAPGFNYFITNRLALEASIGLLGFSSMKPDVQGAEATTNFDFNVGINSISFGLLYKFN